MPKKIAILGLGWLGLPLAKALYEKGYEIKGSTTSSQKLMSLLQSKFSVRIIEIKDQIIRGNLKTYLEGVDTLVITIPPSKTGIKEESFPNVLKKIAEKTESSTNVVFISSTSVYGNHAGVKTESTPANPTKPSGKIVLNGEKIIQNHFGPRATIVRFAGLYGKDRHPGNFLKEDKLLENPNGSVNMIHQEDCIELISRIIEKKLYGEIINGCANDHPKRIEFFSKAAENLNKPIPKFNNEEAQFDSIVDNQKSKELLEMEYAHQNPIDFF